MSELTCPFCSETEFDAIGLKHHLLDGYCDEFEHCDEPEPAVEYGPPTPTKEECYACQTGTCTAKRHTIKVKFTYPADDYSVASRVLKRVRE